MDTESVTPRAIAGVRELSALAARLLSLAADESDIEALASRIVLEVHEASGFECVGLRLKDGEDYPYFVTVGFQQSFVRKEMYLCARDPLGELIRDSDGNPYLECMCGNIISGRVDPSLPFFTPGGSFWSNNTTALLASTSAEQRQARTRNRCNSEGYETVVLLPLRLGGTIFGLLQLNDHRIGALTPDALALLEAIAVAIAMVFRIRQDQIDAARQTHDLRVGLTARTAILERISNELQAREGGASPVPPALISTLKEILDDLSRAAGFVTICAVCKRVRQASDQWYTVEEFIAQRSHLHFSHGYCPTCYDKAMVAIRQGR
jgi:hypothetical protein